MRSVRVTSSSLPLLACVLLILFLHAGSMAQLELGSDATVLLAGNRKQNLEWLLDEFGNNSLASMVHQ